jgi:hypothetical protein
MQGDVDYGASGVDVVLRIREDDPYVKPVVESFSDGTILGISTESAGLAIALRVPAAGWPAAVSWVEERLDTLKFNWRAHVFCRRP